MDTTPIVINSFPSAKEQLVAGGIAIVVTVAGAAAIFGTLALVGFVSEKINKKNSKKDTSTPEEVVTPAE
jgi:hypothetical protein